MIDKRVLFSSLFLIACGSSGLEREDVTGIGPGDATGEALSGDYEVELYVADCLGDCGVVQSGVFTISLCDVGDLDVETIEVEQSDGSVVLEGSGLQVERLTGGVNRDGSYEVGGFGTENGGSVEVFVRSAGVIDGSGLTGTGEQRGRGSVGDQRFDCTAIYEVNGERL